MIKLAQVISICFLCFTAIACEENKKALVMLYDEVEDIVGIQSMRYIINDQYLRIDAGQQDSDFILYDKQKKTVFSVNHEDRTVLKIAYKPWKQPEFQFNVSVKNIVAKNAPEVFGKQVFDYQILADDMLCTQVFLVKDMYPDAMQILYDYQQLLSGQQVASLKNTPEELHTPCFLLDQVFHKGDYYKLGLPIQITYSRGYTKLLKDVREEVVDNSLFVLPEGYEEYLPFVE